MRRYLDNQIIRSIGGVGGAALFAQAVGLAASPLISRLFSQGDYGRFGLFFGLANVLVTIALFGFVDALLAAHDDADAHALLAACIYSVVLWSPVLTLASWIAIRFDLFSYGALPWWSPLPIALEVGAIGMVMLLQMWLVRRRQFRNLAAGHVAQGVFRASGQIGAGVARLGYGGLAMGDVIGRTAAASVLARFVRDDLRVALRLPRRDVARVAWRYRMFPVFRTPSMMVNNMATALPPALVAMAYGVSAAGVFTLMTTVLVAPSGLVQKAVGDVFLGHFAALFRSDPSRARRFLLRVAGVLVLLSLVPGVILALWGPPAFVLLYGAKWRLAGELARLMVPVLMADFAIGPLGGALNVVNRPDAKLVFDAARLGGYAGAYLIATRGGLPLTGMASLFAEFGVVAYLIYAALIYFGTLHPRPFAEVRVDPQAIPG